MIQVKGRLFSIMILYVVSLHLVWAFLLYVDQSAINATALNALSRFIQPTSVLVWVLMSTSSLSILALAIRSPWMVVLLFPQQVILMMSAAGAMEAVWLAQFADGVLRPRAFIAADQLYSVTAAIGHMMAIVAHALDIQKI